MATIMAQLLSVDAIDLVMAVCLKPCRRPAGRPVRSLKKLFRFGEARIIEIQAVYGF
jgi:hypothetical protein